MAIVDAKDAVCDVNCGVVPLNARLENGVDGIVKLVPHVTDLTRVLLFEKEVPPVEIQTERPKEIIAEPSVKVVKKRQIDASEKGAIG